MIGFVKKWMFVLHCYEVNVLLMIPIVLQSIFFGNLNSKIYILIVSLEIARVVYDSITQDVHSENQFLVYGQE